MTFVSLSIPTWPTDAATSADLARRALLVAPRIRLEPAVGVLWADGRGLDAAAIARQLLDLTASAGLGGVGAGVASTPIAALVAARAGAAEPIVVAPGADRDFLAPHDVGDLVPPPAPSLFPLLAGIGIECCRDLAALDLQSVEVRFGAEGVRIWRLARADDRRPIFAGRQRELPHALLEWVDYDLSSQEQVVFIVNSLLATVTGQLAARREGAHVMMLEFALADRTSVELPVRCSTPTSDRKTWLRVTRATLEPVVFAAPVVSIGLRVVSAAALSDRQGNLFDRGHGTARAAETALAHLLDRQADAVVTGHRIRHPLPERRLQWAPDPTGQLPDSTPAVVREPGPPALSIQLLPDRREITVWTVVRRGQTVPDRYYDGTRNYTLTVTLGPDRVSGGFGDGRFARDYFQGVRQDGVMVLLYHDLESGSDEAHADRWYLGGWWD